MFLSVILALFVPVLSYGAEAEVNTEIILNSSIEKTINFVEKNPAQFREAAGLELLEDLGNGKLKVRRGSPKGDLIWIMQENIEKKDGLYRYQTTLVESIEGGIEKSDTDIVVQSYRRGTSVSVRIAVTVNNKRIRNNDLRISLNSKVNKVRRLLEFNLDGG